MTGGLVYVVGLVIWTFILGKKEDPNDPIFGTLIFVIVFLTLLLLAMLVFGVYVIYSYLWLLVGKEIIEANSKLLRITRQIFRWNSVKEYVAGEVKDLRVDMKQSQFLPLSRMRRYLGRNGVIAFDYGAKTFRFGGEIDEAEAKQIIQALEEGFQLPEAG